MNIPDPAPVIEIMEGFRRSKTMFVAVNMGVFDLLEAGPLTSDQVAAALSASFSTNQDATQRLLEGCLALGLLELQDGRFSNSPSATTYLCKSSERAITGYILYSNAVLYQMWGNLEDAVREGTPRWEQTFGWPGPIFEHFFSTPEKMRTFTMGMHGLGVSTSPDVVRAFDLSGFRKMVDLGAATGHLVIAACEAWPELHGVVFDMEKVTIIAREFVEKSPARDRITLQAGDFFLGELPPADLYALGRILHDWPLDKIRLLLRRIADQLPSGGGLLIAEKLLAEDRSGPVGAHMQSINMLICTEGKERSFPEYQALLLEAGFAVIDGKRTGKYLDAILAVKG
jgi:acetylserotonin N-methyltransferase